MPVVQNAQDFDIEYILQQSNDKLFNEYIPKNISSRMYEVLKVSNDNLCFKLIDKNQRDLLSSNHGNIKIYNNIEYFEIIGTYSKLERRGYLTYLFEILIYDFDYKVLSDYQHSSPGSKEFWQAHIKRKKFNIYRLNLKTNYKRNANSFDEDEIWGKTSSHRYELSYFIEDDIVIVDEVGDLDNSNTSYEVIDEDLDTEDLNNEQSNPEFEDENVDISFEDIRLVAQKYI